MVGFFNLFYHVTFFFAKNKKLLDGFTSMVYLIVMIEREKHNTNKQGEKT